MRPMYFFSLATISPLPSRIITPYAAGPGLPREPPSMLARYAAATGLGSAGASPDKSFPREVGGRFGIRDLSKPPKLSLRDQPENLLQETGSEVRELGRSFRHRKPHHWFSRPDP